MEQYICATCKKGFKQKGHMQSHLNRKRPCKASAVPQQMVQTVLDYTKKTRPELLAICKEKGHKGLSGLKKGELVTLLMTNRVVAVEKSVQRLNYIGSKFQLIDWLTETILAKTGWSGFAGRRIADLFSGTGIVAHHFRLLGACVLANDAELYSSIITHAFVQSCYNERCRSVIDSLQKELDEKKHNGFVGYISRNYSPVEGCERMFFTPENASRIDYVRKRIEELGLNANDRAFVLASLLISADAISNVPAVYGCFLKNFKAKALKEMQLVPIHTRIGASVGGSRTYNSDVLSLNDIEADLVYLDPPYNERQYSKNYFPLNIIAKSPESESILKGKTGIPSDCFLSPFCRKGEVEAAFSTLFKSLKAQWIFLSYNSESLIGKERMLEIMGQFGTAGVIERDYKRFKSFEYNKNVEIKEYLFYCKKPIACA
jgi:adenine-specific DNA-methyltransferase